MAFKLLPITEIRVVVEVDSQTAEYGETAKQDFAVTFKRHPVSAQRARLLEQKRQAAAEKAAKAAEAAAEKAAKAAEAAAEKNGEAAEAAGIAAAEKAAKAAEAAGIFEDADTDAETLRADVLRIDGLQNADGEPLEYSPDHLEQLLEIPEARQAMMLAWIKINYGPEVVEALTQKNA